MLKKQNKTKIYGGPFLPTSLANVVDSLFLYIIYILICLYTYTCKPKTSLRNIVFDRNSNTYLFNIIHLSPHFSS